MMMSRDLVKYLIIDMALIIVLHPLPMKEEVDGITDVFKLLSMRHGVSLKETGKTLFGIIGKVGMKL